MIGTHNQSDDDLCARSPAAVRAAQHAEIAALLRASGIPATDTVIVAGDLNVDRDTAEYPAMLSRLNAAGPDAFTGHPISYATTRSSPVPRE